MQRYQHLFSESVVENWNFHKNEYDLGSDVKNENNRAGFVSFKLYHNNGKLNCVLFIKDDETRLAAIENELAQAIVDNSRFFQSFKLAKSVKKERAVCGYMLSTQDLKTMGIMLNYVDSKLQFTTSQYNSIKSMIAEGPNKETDQRIASVKC